MQVPVVVELQNRCLPWAVASIITVWSSSAADSANRPCGLVTASGPTGERLVQIEGETVQGVTFGQLGLAFCQSVSRAPSLP